jgi:hypothetical protein
LRCLTACHSHGNRWIGLSLFIQTFRPSKWDVPFTQCRDDKANCPLIFICYCRQNSYTYVREQYKYLCYSPRSKPDEWRTPVACRLFERQPSVFESCDLRRKLFRRTAALAMHSTH